MSNVHDLRDFTTNSLSKRLQKAVDDAVNVPKPNENTDLHLAKVSVGDLRKVITLLRAIT